jgi:precorrin-3B methylase
MLTLVLIGNSETRLVPGREPRIYTPRGYQGKAGSAS